MKTKLRLRTFLSKSSDDVLIDSRMETGDAPPRYSNQTGLRIGYRPPPFVAGLLLKLFGAVDLFKYSAMRGYAQSRFIVTTNACDTVCIINLTSITNNERAGHAGSVCMLPVRF